MPTSPVTELSLRLSGDTAFLPLAVAFAEHAGRAYGFGEAERYRLELSAEEIFPVLCALLGPTEPVEILAHNGVHCLTLRFLFRPRALNLRVLNLTAKVPMEKGEGTEELGLFVVARMVDALKLTTEPDGRTGLTVMVERHYAEATLPFTGSIPTARSWRLRPAEREDLQLLASLVKAHYSETDVPGFLDYPGKAVDMMIAGDLRAAVAVTEGGAICGGILWTWISEKIIDMSGPFLFPPSQPAALGDALIDQLVESAVKTTAVGILTRRPAGQTIPPGFDLLGPAQASSAGAPAGPPAHAFRPLHEDEGLTVFCHPVLEPFLRREYDRLILPRQLQVIPSLETGAATSSVLTCETQRANGRVVLRGLCFGHDLATNLREHLTLFAEQNLSTILFVLDLGVSWQSAFAPALLETGFTPQIIIPYAGRADTVIFQKT